MTMNYYFMKMVLHIKMRLVWWRICSSFKLFFGCHSVVVYAYRFSAYHASNLLLRIRRYKDKSDPNFKYSHINLLVSKISKHFSRPLKFKYSNRPTINKHMRDWWRKILLTTLLEPNRIYRPVVLVDFHILGKCRWINQKIKSTFKVTKLLKGIPISKK